MAHIVLGPSLIPPPPGADMTTAEGLQAAAASVMIPAPSWFEVLDVAAADLPMAWFGLSFANRLKPAAAA